MKTLEEINRLLASTEAELIELESSRSKLLSRIAELQRDKAALIQSPGASDVNHNQTVANQSSQDEKITLFQSLFRGREDVYSRRFESMKTDKQGRAILATGRYLGEGFDDERLDTLFLALPISWRGTLTQYAGRLHRLNAAKKEVIIYDYVDFDVPVLARMHSKRRAGYKALGYDIELPQENKTVQLTLVDM
jgi:superfamily II DNA or RNA helicase